MAMAERISPELSQGQGQGKQRNQFNDLESDSDQEEDHATTIGTGPAVAGSVLRAQVIHSGHFMVSSPHSDRTPRRRKSGATVGYDFDTVNRTWCQTYRFGPLSSGSLSIDPTLTRLFECMSLAYSGNIVSPKWKSFKGLRLLWRDKIRLNNGIWRAWFIQRGEEEEPCVWVLSPPWRAPRPTPTANLNFRKTKMTFYQSYRSWKLTISYTSNADMIQPGLTPLQANLDDFMDIPGTFTSHLSLEQADYADCTYFESSSSVPFPSVSTPVVTSVSTPVVTSVSTPVVTSVLTPVVTAPQLNVHTQPAQPNFSSSNSGPDYQRHPLTSDMTFNPINNPKFKGHQQQDYHIEYHPPSMVSGAIPSYGHQPYPGATISMATTNIQQQQPVSMGDGTFLYPPPCHKYSYHANSSTSSVPSTIITHTGSTMGGGILGSDPHVHHRYPTMYSPTSCLSQGYPSVAPQSQSAPPSQTSCLAKLQSSSTQELHFLNVLFLDKPTLGFDATLVATKGHRSSSPNFPRSSSSMRIGGSGSQLQPGSPWSSRIPPLTPVHCQTSTLGRTGLHTGTSHSSAISAFLTQGSTHTNTPLLIPKTEKLSPVQIYDSDLTVSFSGASGQTSPTNLLERESNPESPHSLNVHSKMESNKTQSRRITHISAEQKRRFNIKLGFDTLHSLSPQRPLSQISKATTLHKTVEHISKIQQERVQLHEEAQRLRGQILLLNSAIKEKFREYVRAQTLQNWKFWIFSIIIEPLFETYMRMVSTASVEDLCRTTLTSTSILTDPSLVPEQATHAVTQAQCLLHPTHPQDHSSSTWPINSPSTWPINRENTKLSDPMEHYDTLPGGGSRLVGRGDRSVADYSGGLQIMDGLVDLSVRVDNLRCERAYERGMTQWAHASDLTSHPGGRQDVGSSCVGGSGGHQLKGIRAPSWLLARCNVPSHPVEVAVRYDGVERCVFSTVLCSCLVRCPLQHQAGEKSARDWESRTTDKSFIRGRHPSASHVVLNTETLTAVSCPTIPLFRREGDE
ncbi:unnamed protein product [Coregonus sp. 'balchen']|nr:unnamed protein product [Coregonus sp. 'balchen']